MSTNRFCYQIHYNFICNYIILLIYILILMKHIFKIVLEILTKTTPIFWLHSINVVCKYFIIYYLSNISRVHLNFFNQNSPENMGKTEGHKRRDIHKNITRNVGYPRIDEHYYSSSLSCTRTKIENSLCCSYNVPKKIK